MIYFYLYDPKTGYIVQNGFLPSESDVELQDRDGLVSGKGIADSQTQYVNLSDKSIQPKIDNPVTLSGITLSNLPLPCTVTMRGPITAKAYVEQDDLTLEADLPGRYVIKVVADHPKYHDAEFEVDL